MATCFDDLIGIKSGCSLVTGTSGLYIEDIGITEKEADMYINSEYRNGSELITDKLGFAANLVKQTIHNHFSAYIQTKTKIDSQSLGEYQDSLNLKSGAVGTLGGININLVNSNSHLQVYINSISLQLSTTQSTNVLVYDLVSGTLLDTIAVSCVANTISTTYVNKTYQAPKRKLDLIFVYDTEGLFSNTTYLNSACMNCNGYMYSNSYINSQGINLLEAGSKIRSALNGSTHTYGMSINYSVQCSMENWICEMSNLIALPILYKFGEEVMNYSLYYSNRQNSKTNIDYDRNKERLAMYQMAYNQSLESSIKKINLPTNDICFKCNEVMRTSIILP